MAVVDGKSEKGEKKGLFFDFLAFFA